MGDNIVIFTGGLPTLIGGTSASSPAFASVITRINLERQAKGKSTVGFLNPTLYKNPQVLHDITTGDNPGCGTDGFTASTGWDPVTGLGESSGVISINTSTNRIGAYRNAELPGHAQALHELVRNATRSCLVR